MDKLYIEPTVKSYHAIKLANKMRKKITHPSNRPVICKMSTEHEESNVMCACIIDYDVIYNKKPILLIHEIVTSMYYDGYGYAKKLISEILQHYKTEPLLVCSIVDI